MIWPPSVLRVKIRSRDRRFTLWLPLFLVWPVGIALLAMLGPFVLVLAILVWPLGWARPLLLTGPLLFRLFCSLRGLDVNVEAHHGRQQVSHRRASGGERA